VLYFKLKNARAFTGAPQSAFSNRSFQSRKAEHFTRFFITAPFGRGSYDRAILTAPFGRGSLRPRLVKQIA
jgi:hypothetical protein